MGAEIWRPRKKCSEKGLMAHSAHNKAAREPAPSGRKAIIKTQTNQQQLARAAPEGSGARGSLSSAASSSGCSSEETCSIELPLQAPPPSSKDNNNNKPSEPARQAQGASALERQQQPRSPARRAQVSPAASECFEVNELLYLGRAAQPAGSKASQVAGEELGLSAAKSGARPHEPAEMSEFSAFTLGRSFAASAARLAAAAAAAAAESAPQKRPPGGASKAPAANVRRSFTVKLASATSSSGGRRAKQQQQVGVAEYCCCCSGHCAAPGERLGRAELPPPPPPSSFGAARLPRRRATTIAPRGGAAERRRPPSPAASAAATKDGRPMEQTSRLAATVRRTQATRPAGRRSLPVPPPVVPLYKEMALFGADKASETSCSTTNTATSTDEAGSLRLGELERGCSEANQSGQSTLERQTRSMINIQRDIEALLGRRSVAPAADELLDYDDFYLDDVEEGAKQRFYCRNWNDLRALTHQRLHFEGRRTALSCFDISSAPGAAGAKMSPNSSVKGEHSSDMSSTCSRFNNRAGFALGKRTGKFLERLKQTFLANFNTATTLQPTTAQTSAVNYASAAAAAAAAASSSNHNISCSARSLVFEPREGSSDLEKDLEITDASSADLRLQQQQQHETRKELPSAAAEQQPIYDTPEFNAQGRNRESHARRARAAARPSMPPPPPPPPPLARSAANEAMRAPLARADEAQRDCVLANCCAPKSEERANLNIVCCDIAQSNCREPLFSPSTSNKPNDEQSRLIISTNREERKDFAQAIREAPLSLGCHQDKEEEEEVKRLTSGHIDENCAVEERNWSKSSTRSSNQRTEIKDKELQRCHASQVEVGSGTKRKKAVKWLTETKSDRKVGYKSGEPHENLIDKEAGERGKISWGLYQGKEAKKLDLTGGNRSNLNHSNKEKNIELARAKSFKSARELAQRTSNQLLSGATKLAASSTGKEVSSGTHDQREGNPETRRIRKASRPVNNQALGQEVDFNMGASQSVAGELAPGEQRKPPSPASEQHQKSPKLSLDKACDANTNKDNDNNNNNYYYNNKSGDSSIKSLTAMTSKLVNLRQHQKGAAQPPDGAREQPKAARKPQERGQKLHQAALQPEINAASEQINKKAAKKKAASSSPAITRLLDVGGLVKFASLNNNNATCKEEARKKATLEQGGLESHLEKRRKSIQNGDVFIYPSLYKDLNECSKCSRDNRICNCNDLDVCQESPAARLSVDSARDDNEQPDAAGQLQSLQPQETSELKTVYKISISTASINQKSNQLRLFTPKLIVPGELPQAKPRSLARDARGQLDAGPRGTRGEAEPISSLISPLTAISISKSPELVARRETAAAGAELQAAGRKAKFAERDESSLRAQSSGGVSTEGQYGGEDKYAASDLESGEAELEAKVTAISIGSPARSLEALNFGELLPPLLLSAKPDCLRNDGASKAPAQVAPPDHNNNNIINIAQQQQHQQQQQLNREQQTKQLTCNLSLGDSIKITSASVRIGSPLSPSLKQASGSCDNGASVVPIQTLSARRRNGANRLNRQAILEDELRDECFGESALVPALPRLAAAAGQINVEAAKGQGGDEGAGDALEYSPILAGVRDYIKNINTELQVQSSPDEEQLTITTSGGPEPSIAVSEVGALLGAEPRSGAELAGCSSSMEKAAAGAGAAAATSGASSQTTVAFKSPNELESLKKSIFEGASRDEILEYLEDARERVPEILMAADDVMVIGENELIVVNQLEPGSPATPISIVEAAEVIGAPSGGLCGEQFGASTELAKPAEPSPEELRKHLELMYQSRQSGAESSQFSSSAQDTTDDETGLTSEQSRAAGFQSSELDSASNSLDMPNCCASLAPRSDDQDHASTSTLAAVSTSCAAPQAGGLFCGDLKSVARLVADASEELFDASKLSGKAEPGERGQVRRQASFGKADGAMMISGCSTNSSPLEPSQLPTTAAALVSSFNSSTIFATGRRNSSSESAARRLRGANGQLITLQQLRYSNRDSLSSSSSSPPSSASPSSTASSNQTSGNCSAASTFYASSSLSCSSPLLALAAQSQSPAFGAPPIVAAHQQGAALMSLAASLSPAQLQSQLGAELELSNTTYSSQLLESLVKEAQQLSSAAELAASQLEPNGWDRAKLFAAEQFTLKTHADCLEAVVRKQDSLGKACSPRSSPKECDIILEDELSGAASPRQAAEAVKLSCAPKESSLHRAELVTTTMPELKGRLPGKGAASGPATGCFSQATFASSTSLTARSLHGHYATTNRLNNYFMNRHPLSNTSDSTIEFQCLDCDQFIDVDHATMLTKTNELRLLRGVERRCDESFDLDLCSLLQDQNNNNSTCSPDQLDRAYIAAMNGLPLCKSCEKKRVERKEIVSEFVETELKYGRDLKIIHDEFYRPMQIAGLLSKEQIVGVFLNLEELIMAHCRFADRLESATREAHSMGDSDYNTISLGRLFLESAEMLHTFESYCIRQGSAACLLARLAKEKELLRIFLRVSQMENTLLRRMNLAAFLMVPVQRVTKYPLLLNRLYKVTAYHHKDREALRDAQLKVELHLEHINQQTKGVGATNKIWRRISNLSAPMSNRRGLINADDIGYIKLRKTAMDMLKWDRDETQFIHSGRLNFAPLNEYLVKQKMKPLRYMAAHALLMVHGKPNWKYRPDLVKSNLDNKLMTPTVGGNGIKEAALLLFREKNGRFVPCREPLFLSNCVLSTDCSVYNSECPLNQPNHHAKEPAAKQPAATTNGAAGGRKSVSSAASPSDSGFREGSADSGAGPAECGSSAHGCNSRNSSVSLRGASSEAPSVGANQKEEGGKLQSGDTISMSSLKSLAEEQAAWCSPPANAAHTSRSFSLASALPKTQQAPPTGSTLSLSKSTGSNSASSSSSSNSTILNQLMTKVNSYHQHHNQPKQQGEQATSKQAAGAVASLAAQMHQQLQQQQSGAQQQSQRTEGSTCAQAAASSDTQPHNKSGSGSAGQSAANQQQQTTTTTTTSAHANLTGTTCHANSEIHQHYSHHYFHNHHQPYGDFEESFEIHERLSKESMLLRADTPLKTRYWLQMLRYHAKDLGQWRQRRHALANIMMMRQE